MKQPISTKNPSVPTWPQHVSIAEASEMLSPGNWLGKPKQLGRFGSLRPPDIDRELVEEKFWLVQSNPCCWYVFDILFKYDICNILLYIIIHLAICIYIYIIIYIYLQLIIIPIWYIKYDPACFFRMKLFSHSPPGRMPRRQLQKSPGTWSLAASEGIPSNMAAGNWEMPYKIHQQSINIHQHPRKVRQKS